ncbi:host cell division inhibitor Icd-like protein [Xenorhabdus bovienii]|uniref:Protein ash (Modular protein) n=1 Tax=Xenorhabdus bovienii str. Intermedium TaxID=1379677 RepID=A0A077QH48_XENBV|nr:host cell division inhibitor Icd-like protein [Xenorhabdus bovienii]CDH32518.1 Protein ash (modular protein) [Xenorhabdus bovienii str. Intermedium]
MANLHHTDILSVSPARQFTAPDKNCLPLLVGFGYSDRAPAKSGVRRENLNKQQEATHDAPSVFFCVLASQHLSFKALFAYTYSLVMLAGLPKGRLVSFCASILTPVSVTALSERENSGGDSFIKQKEIATMATIPTQTHFKFVFLSVKRADETATPCRIEAIAPDEHCARSVLSRDFVLFFAGRLPVQEVRHV